MTDDTTNELGPVTDCEVCAALRTTMGALSAQHHAAIDCAEGEAADPEADAWAEGMVHPNEFLAVFAHRKKHEDDTGHQSFGWRFVREARAMARGFVQEDPKTEPFWEQFCERFLSLPVITAQR